MESSLVRILDFARDRAEMEDVAEAVREGLAVLAKMAADKRRRVHELRGALAVLAGQCEMLESGLFGELSEAQRRAIATMARQIDRIEKNVE